VSDRRNCSASAAPAGGVVRLAKTPRREAAASGSRAMPMGPYPQTESAALRLRCSASSSEHPEPIYPSTVDRLRARAVANRWGIR